MFLHCILCYTFVVFCSTQIACLSLPDPKDTARIESIKNIANAIRNEPRGKTINGIDYSINDGPIINGKNLASKIAQNGFATMKKYANKNLRQIYQKALPLANHENFEQVYSSLESFLPRPLSAINFNDESFGEDRLTIKGFTMKAVVEINPDHSIDLSEKQVTSVCGQSLTTLIAQNKLFWIDLSSIEKYNDLAAPHKYVPGVVAYFCVSKSSKFLPLSIQVQNGLKYSRFDSTDEWTLAKMILNSAELNYNQMIHFVETHMTLESIRVELMRTVSPQHPVYAIAEHHFLQLFANTVVGLKKLLSIDTTFDKTFAFGTTGAIRCVKQSFNDIHFTDGYFEKFMATNGLNSIPNFKYRDDSRVIMIAVKKFLNEYLSDYYQSDNMVANDIEIQNWLVAVGKLKDVKGFPQKLKTIGSLVDVVSHIIYLTSIKHHAMNSDSTWHTMSFPYSTPALWAPLPKKKGETINLMAYLPPKKLRPSLIVLFSGFVQSMPSSVTLMSSYKESFLGNKPRTVNAIKEFQAKMSEQQNTVANRESDEKRKYNILNPGRLPHYVWI